MPDAIESRIVSIIHFDDEMNTVSMIPNTLFYTCCAEPQALGSERLVMSNKFVEQLSPGPTKRTRLLSSIISLTMRKTFAPLSKS